MKLHPLFRYFAWFLVCILLTSCEGKRTIVNSLDERDANEIMTYLSGKGIDAYKVRREASGAGASKAAEFDIQVPDSQASQATSLLNQQGLPRKRSQNLLGIFSTGSLVPSEMQEKIRYQAGIADQIAGTIRKFDGVLDADVTISFPQEDPLNPGQTRGKITASVYVKHSGVLDDPNSQLLSRIKRLVAASVTGLDYDNVTVIPERSRFFDTQQSFGGMNLEDKQYVSIWSLVIAKDSLTRFQIIFFSMSTAILLLALTLVWVFWRILPLMRERGGLKALFSMNNLMEEKKVEVVKEEDKEKSDSQSEPPAE